MDNVTDIPLKDIHLPDAISWWPPAIGWWILFGSILLSLLCLLYFIRRCLKDTLRKQAVKELNRIQKKFQDTADAATCVTEISALLRCVTISQNHLVNSAGLVGQEWLKFLDKPLDKPEFSQGVGKLLATAPYRRQVSKDDANQLVQLCQKWVNHL